MCDASILCLDSIDGTPWGIALEVFVLLYCFVGLALICDEYLVPSLETLCVRLNIPEDVAGASFMAVGSAAPEIIINSLQTAKGGSAAGLGLGAIIGSGMIAFLVIPGLCGVIAGNVSNDELQQMEENRAIHKDDSNHELDDEEEEDDGNQATERNGWHTPKEGLLLKRRPLMRDLGFYSMALLLLCRFLSDGVISLLEAGWLLGLYVIYLTVMVLAPKIRSHHKERQRQKKQRIKNQRAEQKRQQQQKENKQSLSVNESTALLVTSLQTYASVRVSSDSGSSRDVNFVLRAQSRRQLQFQTEKQEADNEQSASPSKTSTSSSSSSTSNLFSRLFDIVVSPLRFLFAYTVPKCPHDSPRAYLYPVSVLCCLVWLAAFSSVLSSLVERWVSLFHLSLSFLGLMLVAVGAEVPDCVQSISVALRGYGSMAVSNSMGSQIANICLGLGMPWVIASLIRGDGSVKITDHEHIQRAAVFQAFNLILFFVLLPLAALCFKQYKVALTRPKGFLLLCAYVVSVSGYAWKVFSENPTSATD